MNGSAANVLSLVVSVEPLVQSTREDHRHRSRPPPSTRTSGWHSAIYKSCFAALDGFRRPYSHCS